MSQEFKRYSCSVDFGSYRYDVGAESKREAKRIVEDSNDRTFERAIEGDSQAIRDLEHDLHPMISCELALKDDDEFRGVSNVEDGFVYGEVVY